MSSLPVPSASFLLPPGLESSLCCPDQSVSSSKQPSWNSSSHPLVPRCADSRGSPPLGWPAPLLRPPLSSALLRTVLVVILSLPWFTATPTRLLQNVRAGHPLHMGPRLPHHLLCCHGTVHCCFPANYHQLSPAQ